MALSAGMRLGSCEILEPLGAGGMGEVYRARDTRLGRDVAVKVLPADRLSDPARHARFEQEARAASKLNHPHIVTIHEIESAEGIDFIVMELVPGGTLDALIPGPGMRLGEALRIAIPLADALAAAHAAGIVHRDLKPANVMVTPEGVVKVLDFGLAKLRPHDRTDSEEATTVDARAVPLTRAGTAAGTPAYMSPEQASGNGFTAVGIPAAVRRFAMLQCYDNVREARLPPELRNRNPGGVWRRIDGKWTLDDVKVG